MSLTVSVEDVKERLEELVDDAAERHEDLLIAKNGAPWARLVPLKPVSQASARQPGMDRGKFVVPPEFFDPLPEDIVRAFEGEA